MRHFLFLLLSFALVSVAEADTVLHYTSEAGDYIGGGNDRTLTPDGGYTFTVNNGVASGVSISIDYSGPNGAYDFNRVSFSPPAGSTLAVGEYPGATRDAFRAAGEPGLEFSTYGRGSNQLTGQFQVLEITFDVSGNLAAFAANFVQHSEGAAPACYGEIRYNSSVPFQSPAGFGHLGADHYSAFAKDGRLSVTAIRREGSVGPLSINYSTEDGTDLNGRDYTGVSGTISWADGETANKTFTVPILNAGNPLQGNGTFLLHVSGPGAGAQREAVVTVVNDDSSVTYVHWTSDAGDYIGIGKERTFDSSSGFVLKPSRNYDGGVSFDFDAKDEFWSMDFAAAKGTVFAVGNYPDAQRFPFQEEGHPGLDVSGDGRGSNELTGSFQVLEAEFDPEGNVLRFAADFVQHSEGATPALHGQVRYRSTVPMDPSSPTGSSPGAAEFAAANYTVNEQDGTVAITVARKGGTYGPLTVNYMTTDDSAIAGRDYAAASGALMWANGDGAPQTFNLPILDSGATDGSTRTVNLQLTGPKLGAVTLATLTIVENARPALTKVSVVATVPKTQESGGAPGAFTITRSGDLSVPLKVKFALSGSALNGRDYQQVKKKVAMEAGKSSARVQIRPIDLKASGGKTTVTLTLLPNPGVYVVTQDSAKLKILHNE